MVRFSDEELRKHREKMKVGDTGVGRTLDPRPPQIYGPDGKATTQNDGRQESRPREIKQERRQRRPRHQTQRVRNPGDIRVGGSSTLSETGRRRSMNLFGYLIVLISGKGWLLAFVFLGVSLLGFGYPLLLELDQYFLQFDEHAPTTTGEIVEASTFRHSDYQYVEYRFEFNGYETTEYADVPEGQYKVGDQVEVRYDPLGNSWNSLIPGQRPYLPDWFRFVLLGLFGLPGIYWLLKALGNGLRNIPVLKRGELVKLSVATLEDGSERIVVPLDGSGRAKLPPNFVRSLSPSSIQRWPHIVILRGEPDRIVKETEIGSAFDDNGDLRSSVGNLIGAYIIHALVIGVALLPGLMVRWMIG